MGVSHAAGCAIIVLVRQKASSQRVVSLRDSVVVLGSCVESGPSQASPTRLWRRASDVRAPIATVVGHGRSSRSLSGFVGGSMRPPFGMYMITP